MDSNTRRHKRVLSLDANDAHALELLRVDEDVTKGQITGRNRFCLRIIELHSESLQTFLSRQTTLVFVKEHATVQAESILTSLPRGVIRKAQKTRHGSRLTSQRCGSL